ncbi:inhibitor of nuclear factor kappa-B kinase subunit alpha [Manduca sexta]|uniref:inhibitor of nuclear factor kappa-B kinase subunit alpha n=1 Tax=Manduca sexta TaxID=7130 RepID=UPI00188FDA41|nr:inhibitor of nuclear factor kappa-B kinase subunit alpha [Manduca sexta]
MDDKVFIGEWIKDRILGSGTFGIVVLWRHKKTDEKLAIKTCKWGKELTEKHRERWTKEVEMLRDCRNPNIVGTKELPQDFIKGLENANPSGLPIMCMEYCTGGDLRQVLHKPDSCAGLKEYQIRQILKDIGNAMQFLHQRKIAHRDLKPENIVIHIESPGNSALQTPDKVTYKLIDLGYAKEIDFNSVCASFVGTLQYLAPELIYSKTYSNSVDYWSFGLLAFEIICGVRPFLPYMAPAQLMSYLEKKTHDQICIYESFLGDIEYSNEIFPENHISKPFKKFIEEWLKVALEWDPKLRGRDSPSKVTFNIPSEQKSEGSKIIIFDLLSSILAKKIIKIFSVSTLSHLAYNIDNTITVATLRTWIHKDTNMPVEDQILICQSTCIELGDNELVINFWKEHCNIMLYLINKTAILQDDLKPAVPHIVQRSVDHPKALYNYKNAQNLYRDSLYFIITQAEIYNSLINAMMARGESLKSVGRQLLLGHNNVDKNIGNLLSKVQISKKMVEMGKEHINNLKETGTGTNLLGGFSQIFKKADDIFDKISKLQCAWDQLFVRLQSAKRRCNEVITEDIKNFVDKYNYKTLYTSAFKTYLLFKKSETVAQNRGAERQCLEMATLCSECLKLRKIILKEIKQQRFVRKLMDLSVEFSKINDIVKNAADNTEKLSEDLLNIMDDLNKCTWSTISLVIKDGEHLADMPYSVVAFDKTDFKVGGPVSNHSAKIPNLCQEREKLASLIEDSLKIRKSQMYLVEKIQAQKELFKPVFDFSFLDDKQN